MKTLILAILIACSLGVSGCTDDNSSGLQEDTKPITEEKVEEPEKEQPKKEEEEKEVDTKKTEEEEERELEERVTKRNIVIGNCYVCDKVLQRNDDYEETDQYGFICRSCYNKSYGKCIDCGKTVNAYDDGVSAGSTGLRCKDCTEAYMNDTSDIEPMEYGDDYGDYYCEECGSGLSPEEVCTQNGRTLCPDCAFGEDLEEQGLDHQE